MPLSPEALAKIAEAIPDTYDTNPDQFATDWQAMQQARSEAERLKEVGDWYETTYKPWFNTYGSDFTEFQKWKQGQGTQTDPAPTSTRRATDSQTIPEIDFSDPAEAVRHVYDYVNTKFEGATQQLKTLDATIQQRSQELQNLLALQEQAYQLQNESQMRDVARVLNQPDWKPTGVDIPKVVSYAQQNNIGDLRRAYELYSQSDRVKELEAQAFERGRKAAEEEARRAAATQSVTTEVTAGAPFRHRSTPEIKRGYGTGMDDIMTAIALRRQARAGSA